MNFFCLYNISSAVCYHMSVIYETSHNTSVITEIILCKTEKIRYTNKEIETHRARLVLMSWS